MRDSSRSVLNKRRAEGSLSGSREKKLRKAAVYSDSKQGKEMAGQAGNVMIDKLRQPSGDGFRQQSRPEEAGTAGVNICQTSAPVLFYMI
jgi:hypothetical protein